MLAFRTVAKGLKSKVKIIRVTESKFKPNHLSKGKAIFAADIICGMLHRLLAGGGVGLNSLVVGVGLKR
jgi:hypothetical protein